MRILSCRIFASHVYFKLSIHCVILPECNRGDSGPPKYKLCVWRVRRWWRSSILIDRFWTVPMFLSSQYCIDCRGVWLCRFWSGAWTGKYFLGFTFITPTVLIKIRRSRQFRCKFAFLQLLLSIVYAFFNYVLEI